MKKYYYSLALIAFVAAVVLPVAAKAEDDANASPSASASVSVSASASVSPTPVPTPTNIKDKLRAEIEQKNLNLKANQGYRNDMLERQRKMASSTASTTDKTIRKDLKDFKGDIKDVRKDFRDEIKDISKDAKDDAKDFIKDHKDDFKNASTSISKKDIRHEIELNLFKIRKDMLVRQLNLAVDNLKQIRERIASRITKVEQTGRNMTAPKALLGAADAKIVIAQSAITALANINVAPGTTTSGTTTATVKLDKPREVGDTAIKAVKDAREALQKVIESVAKNMGKTNATSTTSVTVTSTTTATTTDRTTSTP